MRRLVARALAALERRVLGMSGEEIRYTFEDVRAELRANHAELKDEIAALRREVDRLAQRGDHTDESDEEEPAAEV